MPDKRVLLGFRHNVIADLTTGGGWTIFDNTIAWLHPAPDGGGNGNNGGGGGAAGPQTITYTYTEAGQPDTITYPDGTVVDVGYDSLGRPDELTADQTTIVNQVSYNARGQLTAATIGNGNNQLTRAWAHENWSGRLLNQTSLLPGGANVQNLSYSYDTGGNVTLTRDQTAGIDQWACFTYDNADRLTTAYTRADGNCTGHQPAAGPDPYNVAISYNQIGNITNATGTGTVNGHYTYSTGNAGPHAVTGAGPNSYAYDQSGNMTTRTTGLGTQTLTYDVRNRIQTITGAGPDLTALYDADGIRVKRTLDNTDSFYLGPNYELTDDATGPEVSLHHRLAGRHVATTIDGELMTITDSQLGTITGTVNAAGVLTAQRYTPHGVNLSANTNLLPFDFTFTGQTDDPGTGLIDYNARHYDPELGRFTQADTVLDGLNRYTYVHNNPLSYTDPTGHCSVYSGDLFCGRNGTNFSLLDRQADLQREDAIRRFKNRHGNDTSIVRTARSESVRDGLPDPLAESAAAAEALAAALPADSYTGYGIWGMRMIVFDDRQCFGEGRSSGGCFVEGIGIVPWGKVTRVGGRLVAPNAARHLCSFSGETQVLMADGTTKPISEVEVGDWVLAEDPETGERGAREVRHLWVHQDTIIDLEIDGHDVATTEDHPFWNHTDNEWQAASALDPGDLVLTSDGATLTVEGMDWGSARTTTAYNLTVDGIHTYFVLVDGDALLVHNTCLPLFDGPKPTYHVNPAHVPGQGLRPGKTPLPSDAQDVFRTAVPDDPYNPRAWYGLNTDGQIYRFSLGNDGTAHFSGIDGVGDGIRNLTPYARDRLELLGG